MNQDLLAPPHRPALHFGVQLPPTPRGARLARLLGTEQLRTWDLAPATVERGAQVLAELAIDAIGHAGLPGRDFRVDLHLDAGTLRIGVACPGLRPPTVPRPAPPGAGAGRGPLLVTAFADRWGVAEGQGPRRTVWAELDLPARTP
ncbi:MULTISPECIES: ATP-binding protein [unclassified Streptomyces]|uniref:ATP-binding protein n=1 Tax=unclassified Streptomyces TaxID=2593676 RepID=UPI000DBA95EC|nr:MULTISPECIES: ATP-binding protein [unclassified Streptomyces]MYT68492.1 ATP-binding protein [Streptomyces sp. SID8367]RAJ86165.1 hypothetical protein K377_03011 [Streptomyces sp. PsTaAH-137]